MSELDTLIINKLETVEGNISSIKDDITDIKVDIAHHISRTDELQDLTKELKDIVTPLYQEYISKKAIEDYKKKQRDELIYRLKLPGYILAALTAIGSGIAWLVRK